MAKWQIIEDTINNYYIYVSKKGNDSTGSGTTTSPYLSINAGVSALDSYAGAKQRVLIVGSGKYINESISISRNIAKPILFYGEGIVCFDANEVNYLGFSYKDSFYNIEFKNYINKYIITCSTQTSCTITANFENCKCYDSFYIGITYSQTYYAFLFSGIIKNCILAFKLLAQYATGGSNIITNWNNNVILSFTIVHNNTIASMSNIKNNIFLSFTPRINSWDDTVDYNCLRTSINYNGTVRDLDWIKANTTSNQYSISDDPLFNNILANNYTLKTESPCLYAGESRSHIGAFGLAYSYNGLSSEFTTESGATLTNISIDENGNMFLTDPLQSGEIETAMITFPKLVKVNLCHLFSTMEFDATGQGIEIIDYDTGSTENSIHYDYLIKYGITESEWSSSTYKPMLFNYNISVDNNGVGNADDNFIVSENSMVIMKYLSLKIKLSVI